MIVKPDLTKPQYGCPNYGRKHTYYSRQACENAAAHARRRTGDKGIRVYRCRGHFHMGHVV